jgi:hypothetical protein
MGGRAEPERIGTAVVRSFERIRAISGEMEEKLSAIKGYL